MTQHPYVGLYGTINNEHSRADGEVGVIVGVVNSVATVLLPDGSHVEMHLSGVVLADGSEAARRFAPPDAVECVAFHAVLRFPPDACTEGYRPMGPWEPAGPAYTHPTGYTMRDWKRPLRRVSRG